MNTLNKFALIVALLLAVQASDHSLKSDGCLTIVPNGFFCSLICQQWKNLKGTTVMCFISDNEHYHWLIGRNPDHGVWRFYKVDETSDMNSLCTASVNGDKLYLNTTDATCSTPEPPSDQNPSLATHRNMRANDMDDTHVTGNRNNTENTDDMDETTSEDPKTTSEHKNSTSESTEPLSIKKLIRIINEEIFKMLQTMTKTTEYAEEEVTTTSYEDKEPAHLPTRRHSSARSASPISTPNNGAPPMADICQLVTTDLCRDRKMITCPTYGDCCWAEVASKACKPENVEQYNECYKGLGPIMSGLLY